MADDTQQPTNAQLANNLGDDAYDTLELANDSLTDVVEADIAESKAVQADLQTLSAELDADDTSAPVTA